MTRGALGKLRLREDGNLVLNDSPIIQGHVVILYPRGVARIFYLVVSLIDFSDVSKTKGSICSICVCFGVPPLKEIPI